MVEEVTVVDEGSHAWDVQGDERWEVGEEILRVPRRGTWSMVAKGRYSLWHAFCVAKIVFNTLRTSI